MVLAFLKGEVDSPRFGPLIKQVLKNSNVQREYLIDAGNVNDEQQNDLRAQLLRLSRGYRADLLFQRFPTDVAWTYVELDPSDVAALRYCTYPTLVKLSGPSRQVGDAVAQVNDDGIEDTIAEGAKQLAGLVKEGKHFPELILVRATDDDGTPVIIEGHTRATAYVLAGIDVPVFAFLGESPGMRRWWLY